VAGQRTAATAYWPLFDLVVRTPRLELRLLREDDVPAMVELIDSGIHDPGMMPFWVPWTDAEPRQRSRDAVQWMWRHRAHWSPDNWTLTSGVFVDGTLVGVQDLGAEHFRAVRSVETGSWLGRAHQGQGIGREMREAILHLAFAGPEAEEALSGAFEDNAASLATSRAVGYEENGEARNRRRNGSGRTIRFRLGRPAWSGAAGRTSSSSGSRNASTCSSASHRPTEGPGRLRSRPTEVPADCDLLRRLELRRAVSSRTRRPSRRRPPMRPMPARQCRA
jgi:RimJ/RimL family protein N-acetyltransferase